MVTKFIQTKAKVLNNGKLERVDIDLLYNNEKQKETITVLQNGKVVVSLDYLEIKNLLK